jgi:hypothetical protein
MFDPIEIQFLGRSGQLTKITCQPSTDALTINGEDDTAHYYFALRPQRELTPTLHRATGLPGN